MIQDRVLDIAAEIQRRGCEPSVGDVGEGHDIQQNAYEFAEFATFCQEHKVKTVLELGTGRTGGLARFMTEVLGWKVTSVDIYKPSLLTPEIEFIQGTTTAVYPYLKHRLYDLVFIDADHSYETVKKDHQLYARMGRIVAFHDIAPGRVCCPDTIKYWQEIAFSRQLKYEVDNEIYVDTPLKEEYHQAIAPEKNAGIGWYINRRPYEEKWIYDEWAQPLIPVAPDVTIVTGTYNRLSHLKNMIWSARSAIMPGMKLVFVITDGGSTDGTIEWLNSQRDITLIKHGALLGAIKAFCDGAKVATGRYVVMANDDIIFHPRSLSSAYLYLEANQATGGVAFSFDEPDRQGAFHVNYQQLVHRGKKNTVVYAQVGMFRKWLGDSVGWWGADDLAFTARTYGGDNYLTSRIYEAGYYIDLVPDAKYSDLLAPDELRNINNHADLIGGRHPDTIAWLKRFNDGLPVFNSTPVKAVEDDLLKILYLPIYADDSAVLKRERIGWRESLQKIASVIELDYVNIGKKAGAAGVRTTLFDLLRAFKPDILLTQVHTPDYLTAAMLAEARAERPGLVVINWNGDESSERIIYPAAINYMRRVDLQLIVNGSLFAPLLENGICRVDYGLDSFQPVEPAENMPSHDVVYLGNCYPLNGSPSPRLEMERRVRSLDINAGFYGRGWEQSDGENMQRYSEQHALYTNAKLTIVDNLYPASYGYVSDRLYNALAYSQCVLWKACAGAELLYGLQEGVHYIGWNDFTDLTEKITLWLSRERDFQCRKIGAQARALVFSRHNYDVRTRSMLDALERLIKHE